MRWNRALSLLTLVAASCSPTVIPRDDADAHDAARDASMDSAIDATTGSDAAMDAQRADTVSADRALDALPDARPDALPDSAPDARLDAVADALPDTLPDALPDAAPDAVSDATADATIDAAVEAGSDAAAERVLARALRWWSVAARGSTRMRIFGRVFASEIAGAPTVQVTEIGLQASVSAGGSMHATLVRLSGPSDTPDMGNLTGSDVVLHTLITFPAGSTATVQRAMVDATVSSGWYAVVFGTGAFGATAASASVPSAGGAGCSLPGSSFPFTIRQSDGMFILQGATPHMFARVRP